MHCGSAAGKARSDELSTEEALQLCQDLKDIDCKGVALMGGEPLLRPDWVAISERVHELGMELSIITNGWLGKNDSVTQQIVDLTPECVTVSLDGGESSVHDMIRGVAGSFERAKYAIERYAGLGLPTSVITTVHKLNLKELTKIRDFLIGKGVAWQIQMATPHGRLERKHVLSQDEFYSVALFISTILPELQVKPWQGCQAGIGTLGIQSNGNIMGCLALPEQFIEGNIRERPLNQIWYDIESFRYSRHVKMSDIKAHCASCEFKRMCKGGCSAVSSTVGRGLHQDPFCVRHIEQAMK
jgi:radical SAM protein with 4Fe4S-binding SPASM domain